MIKSNGKKVADANAQRPTLPSCQSFKQVITLFLLGNGKINIPNP